jgi:4-amino-4-deoxy-L-arabinose transferase-like glycosyltransferase
MNDEVIGRAPVTRLPPRARALVEILMLVLLAAPIVLYRLGRPGLGDPDEGRNAEVAREMLESGDLVTPRLNGARYLDKPPAYFWAVAASFRLLGVGELSARLPSALFALSGIALLAWFARRHLGPRAGWLAGAALALTPLYLVFARTVIFDMMLTVCMAVSGLAAFEAMEGDGRGGRLAGALFFAAAGLGTITKGPVALAAPLLVAAAWAGARRRPALLGRLRFAQGALIFAAIVLPWLWLVSARNPGYLHYALVGENLQRMTSNRFDTARPFYFYWKILLPGLFPWIVFCLAAAARRAWALARGGGAGEPRPPGGEPGPAGSAGTGVPGTPGPRRVLLYAGLWLGVLVLFFSLIASKRPSYMLPCSVPVALLVAGLFSAALGEARPGEPGGAREAARRDLQAGSLAVAVVCAAGSVIFAVAGPGGLARGVAGGRFDDLLSRPGLLGPGAAGLGLTALLLVAARRARRPVLAFAAAAMTIVVMVPPARAVTGYIDRARSSRPVSEFLAARLAPEDAIICYDEYRPGLNFYLRRPVYFVSPPGAKTPRIFTSNYIRLNLEEFRHDPDFRQIPEERMRGFLGRDGAAAYLLAPRRSFAALQAEAGVPLVKIYEDEAGGVFVRAPA